MFLGTEQLSCPRTVLYAGGGVTSTTNRLGISTQVGTGTPSQARRARIPRAVHPRGAVVAFGPDHDARRAAAASLPPPARPAAVSGERPASPASPRPSRPRARFEPFVVGGARRMPDLDARCAAGARFRQALAGHPDFCLVERHNRHPRHGVRYVFMPLTVFDTKGIPAIRREHIEAAVIAGGKHVSAPHEAWIACDPFRNGVRVLITGPHGFQRTVTFDVDEVPAAITQRVRETLDE